MILQLVQMTQRDQGHQKKQKIYGRNIRRETEKEKLGKKNRKEKEVSATCTNDAEGLGTREETKIIFLSNQACTTT